MSRRDRGLRYPAAWSLLVVGTLAFTACKDATLGPSSRGAIDGLVRDFDSGNAVAGASVTTTPPSEALLTDEEGRFSLDDLEAGTYQITARRSGYLPSTVSVAVRESRTAQATIVLQAEDDESPDPLAAFAVEVVGFWASTSGDSTFAEAEYRARNTGEVLLSAYEVYFRIEAGGQAFYHEEAGDTLAVGQTDASRFRIYLPTAASISAVEVDGTWSDPPATSTSSQGDG